MTEHVHEWEICGDEYEHAYVCYGCTEVMGSDDPDIARALNATERLSAEDARRGANRIDLSGHSDLDVMVRLRAYADTLEGKE